jgi:hypothetical protein
MAGLHLNHLSNERETVFMAHAANCREYPLMTKITEHPLLSLRSIGPAALSDCSASLCVLHTKAAWAQC